MKQFSLTIILFLGWSLHMLSQAPLGFNYQAVIRDINGDIMINANVTVKFTIQISDSPFTVIKYQETQTLVTNDFGLISCVIGNGTILWGDMSTVDWYVGERYLKVEVDAGAGFVDTGIQLLVSVPYALSALNASNAWGINGSAGTNSLNNYIGTSDNVPLSFRINNEKAGRIDHLTNNVSFGHLAANSITNGNDNTAIGNETLVFNTSGDYNTAIGGGSLYSNTIGVNNTSAGSNSMHNNTSGDENAAFGINALYSNVTGSSNTAVGSDVLYSNTSGYANVAIGKDAMRSNTSGISNVAVGEFALCNNISGAGNTACGQIALRENLGFSNTGIGRAALVYNTSGSNNSALGWHALEDNETGDNNTAVGKLALEDNVSGNDNTAVGTHALLTTTSSENTALGFDAGGNNTTGSGCTFLGYSAEGSAGTYTNATAIGNQASVTASNRVRIGNTSVTQIGGQVAWSNLSDARLKKNVQPSRLGLDFIKKLKPVTYNFIEGHEGILYTGFLAQDVEKVLNEMGEEFSGVTKPENETDFYAIRYAEFVMPLVNAVQEQQVLIEELQQLIALQQKQIDVLLSNR